MDGLIGIIAPNEVQIEGADETVSLFDCHVKQIQSFSDIRHPTDGMRS